MKRLMRKIKALLSAKNGETLLEGLISIMLFTILVVSVTMMILVSLRLTRNSTADADELQAQANAVQAGLIGEPGVKLDNFAVIELVIDDGSSVVVPITVYETGDFSAFMPR